MPYGPPLYGIFWGYFFANMGVGGCSELFPKTISTIAILWPVKAIFEKRAAKVEVDTLISHIAMAIPIPIARLDV